ncbi:hypothetical protein AAGG74_17400 [Bacillus mexicanus]|uniref:hypothetical protein n=1 Tax=Bacillus mexicanus TaxID=2834415 RepID=UPI003D21229C
MENRSFDLPNPYEKFKTTPIQRKEILYYKHLSKELDKAVPYLKKKWGIQNNRNDKLTDEIVYTAKSFDELIYLYKKKPSGDFNYLIHRWFNTQTSKMAETLFCSYNIVKKEKNFAHKTIDFYIMDTPFDLKVSSYPTKFNKTRFQYDSDRAYRNDLIRWLYENQSKERRKHDSNRLFIICKHQTGCNSKANLLLKKDFDQIQKKINAYLRYSEKKLHNEGIPFNQVLLNNRKTVFSDIIFINN